MAERTLTEIRTERLADLRRRADAGLIVEWASLAVEWGLSQGGVAKRAVANIPGVTIYDGVITLPGGQTLRCLRMGERLSAADRRPEALRILGEMADAGQVLSLPVLAERLGYGSSDGARALLLTIPGLTIHGDALVLPDGRRVSRLTPSKTRRGELVAERILGWLRERHAAGDAVVWRAGAEALGYASPEHFRAAVQRVSAVRREGERLVVEGVGVLRIERANAAKPKAPATETPRRRAATGAAAVRRSKRAAGPPAPRASLSTCAGAESSAPVAATSSVLAERDAAVLAHLEALPEAVMPTHPVLAQALGLSQPKAKHTLDRLRRSGSLAPVPGGVRLPSGRVMRPSRVATLKAAPRPMTPRRPALAVVPEVPGAVDKLTPAAEAPRLPAKVPPPEQWPGADECRWPIGEMRSEAGLSFCRSKTHGGASYCPYHHARAHVALNLAEAAE